MWNDRSVAALYGVNPDLVGVMEEVRRRSGVPFEVVEGVRSPARQQELLAAGKSQTANSRHLGGNALDIFIPTPGGGADYNFDDYVPLGEMFKAVAAERGLGGAVWGGDWESLRDGVHFELQGSGYRAPNAGKLSFPASVPRSDTSAAHMFQQFDQPLGFGSALMERLNPAPKPQKRRGDSATQRQALADLIRY